MAAVAAVAGRAQTEDPPWLRTVGRIFWSFYAGRWFEELAQICNDGVRNYLSSFWNRIDMLLLLVQSSAFGLGVLRYQLDDANPPSQEYTASKTRVDLVNPHHPSLQQVQFDLMVRRCGGTHVGVWTRR
jgi:hypothetical protein